MVPTGRPWPMDSESAIFWSWSSWISTKWVHNKHERTNRVASTYGEFPHSEIAKHPFFSSLTCHICWPNVAMFGDSLASFHGDGDHQPLVVSDLWPRCSDESFYGPVMAAVFAWILEGSALTTWWLMSNVDLMPYYWNDLGIMFTNHFCWLLDIIGFTTLTDLRGWVVSFALHLNKIR